jgi:hypothetical protein
LQAYLGLTERLENLRQMEANQRLAGELAYGFLTRHFSFEAFRRARGDLHALDERLDGAISNSAQIIDGLFRPGATAGRPFDKIEWIRTELTKLASRADLLAFARNAFIESSPMLKLRFLMDGLTAVRTFLIRDCPPAEELGADEFTPALICYIVIARPHAIVSNFVFLAEFCGNRGFKHFDASASIPLVTLAAVIKDAVPDVVLTALTASEMVQQMASP